MPHTVVRDVTAFVEIQFFQLGQFANQRKVVVVRAALWEPQNFEFLQMLELREKFVQVVPFVMAEFDEADAELGVGQLSQTAGTAFSVGRDDADRTSQFDHALRGVAFRGRRLDDPLVPFDAALRQGLVQLVDAGLRDFRAVEMNELQRFRLPQMNEAFVADSGEAQTEMLKQRHCRDVDQVGISDIRFGKVKTFECLEATQ